MMNETKLRIPKKLQPRADYVYRNDDGWQIDLAPGYFSWGCFGRHIQAGTKKEALHFLEMTVEETFCETDSRGRCVIRCLTIERAKERYPLLPEGHRLRSNLTQEPAQYVIPGLLPREALDL